MQHGCVCFLTCKTVMDALYIMVWEIWVSCNVWLSARLQYLPCVRYCRHAISHRCSCPVDLGPFQTEEYFHRVGRFFFKFREIFIFICPCTCSLRCGLKISYYIVGHLLACAHCMYLYIHDDIIKWKHFPRNWPFVRGIHRARWIPHTKASDAELWCFLWSASE